MDFREQLASAIEAVAFRGDVHFEWSGTRYPSIPQTIRVALSPAHKRALTLQLLRECLYRDFYCSGGVRGVGAGSDGPTLPRGLTRFMEMLSRANTGAGARDEGWTCTARAGDALTIERAGLTVRASIRDVAMNESELRPGFMVALRIANEMRKRTPGFYFVLGNEPWKEGAPLLNLYWNVSPPGAIELVRLVTKWLNEARVSFRLKVLDDPSAYTRCDAAVLYLRREEYTPVAPIAAEIRQAVRLFLKDNVPVGAKELAPGLGLAESPAAGGSFGMSRCQWIAEGLLLARDAGDCTSGARLATVEEHLKKNGVDLERPFLDPGSVDRYALPDAHPCVCSSPLFSARTDPEHLDTELPVAARRVAEWLMKYAIQIGDRVVWVGPDPSPDSGELARESKFSTLGPELYSGTSGIALFLAEWSMASGNEPARRLAISALRHALARVRSGAGLDRPGLFDGWSGVALAGARAAVLLEEREFLCLAKDLVQGWIARGRPCAPFDLISGKVGLILSLLGLSDLLQDDRLLEEAVLLGRALLEAAEREGEKTSWKTPAGARNLTGFSHGTAGAAYSLLELFRVTREPCFREGAESAFAYEQACFSPERGNWPDFRKGTRRSGRSGSQSHYPSHWCHGAPGIALSRLSAAELLGNPAYADQARIALITTEREAKRRLSTQSGGLSLCHGLAGDAEVLLCGVRSPVDTPTDPSLPNRLAAAVIRQLGLLSDESPLAFDQVSWSLMPGLAGVGYLFLRLQDPRVPSVLMPRPGELSTYRGSKFSASHTSGI